MTSADERIDIFLQPGEYFVADDAFRIRTILGSCVSITLWHPHTLRGGMSHFLLPSRGKRSADDELDGRYADEALELIVREFTQAGIPLAQCEAKVFGGGNMFPGFTKAAGIPVGQRNGEAARGLLAARGIPIVSESLYGHGHRQIIFDVATGDVWAHQVRPTAQGT